MAYDPPVFVNVPQGTPAPPGAPKLNYATLNAIVTALDGVEQRVTDMETITDGAGNLARRSFFNALIQGS